VGGAPRGGKIKHGGHSRFRGLPEFNLSLRLSKWLYSVPFPRCGLS
jgi:hypothetical protein